MESKVGFFLCLIMFSLHPGNRFYLSSSLTSFCFPSSSGDRRFSLHICGHGRAVSHFLIRNFNVLIPSKSLRFRRARGGGGEGGGGNTANDAVAAGGKHDVRRRNDVVRGFVERDGSGAAEGSELGLRAGLHGLLGFTARRALLRAQRPRFPCLLRLQQLLPAERQLRHRL